MKTYDLSAQWQNVLAAATTYGYGSRQHRKQYDTFITMQQRQQELAAHNARQTMRDTPGPHYNQNFRSSEWRNQESGTLVMVESDAGGADPGRELGIYVLSGGRKGQRYASSPGQITSAYLPYNDWAAALAGRRTGHPGSGSGSSQLLQTSVFNTTSGLI